MAAAARPEDAPQGRLRHGPKRVVLDKIVISERKQLQKDVIPDGNAQFKEIKEKDKDKDLVRSRRTRSSRPRRTPRASRAAPPNCSNASTGGRARARRRPAAVRLRGPIRRRRLPLAGRHDLDVTLQPIELPRDVAQRCLALAALTELPLAGIDLRRTGDGEWYCFEINLSPGFTDYADQTGQQIADAVADPPLTA